MDASCSVANLNSSGNGHPVQTQLPPGTKLTDEELEEIMRVAELTPLGKALVREIRRSPPDSAPRSDRRLGNTTGWFPSALTKSAMAFGSVFPELCALYMVDSRLLSPNVREFWNRVRIRGVDVYDADGRRSGTVSHPVHGLIIETQRIHFFELVRKSKLAKSSHFVCRSDGSWHSPAIEAALAKYGIGYKIVTDDELGKHTLGNLSYLASCYYEEYQLPDEDEVERVVRIVRERGAVRRKDLIEAGCCPEAIKLAVARGLIFFPIDERDLTSTEIVFLYTDREVYLAHKLERQASGALTPPSLRPLPTTGQEISWDGKPWTIINAGETRYCLKSEAGVLDFSISQVRQYCEQNQWVYEAITVPRIMQVSARRRAEAFALLELRYRPDSEWKWPYGKRRGKLMSSHSIERIRRAITAAEVAGTSAVDALVRKYDNSGCRIERTEGEREIWSQCLDEDFMNDIAPTIASVSRTYGARCTAAGIHPVSAETIRKRIRKLDKQIVVREQDGTFAAYSWGPFVPRDKTNSLVKGRIPFEVAHVDSTPVPMQLRCSITGRVQTKTAWLTVMRDACTFRVLAYVIHYGRPSYETLYRLLLEAVRRNGGRLPQYIVCDRALEFKTEQFEATLARYGVVKLNRPARTPRAGQPVESGNRKDELETFMNLAGHDKPDVDFRNLLGEFSPKVASIHTLTDLRKALDEFYYELEPRYPSSRTGMESITDYENRVFAHVGISHIRKIKDNEEFTFLCMPAVPTGYRKVTRQGSVEALTLEYFSEELKHPRIIDSNVLVHYDPDNLGRMIVWAMGRWIECKSDHYELLSQFTQIERLAYQEYLRSEGEDKSIPRRQRGIELGTLLLKARQEAEGRIALGMALENQGKEYSPEQSPCSSDGSQTAIEDGNEWAPADAPVPASTEDEVWSEEDVPNYNSYSDRS